MESKEDLSRHYLSAFVKFSRYIGSQVTIRTAIEFFVTLLLDKHVDSLSRRLEQDATLKIYELCSQQMTENHRNYTKDADIDWATFELKMRRVSSNFYTVILKKRLQLRIVITERGFIAVLPPWMKDGDRLYVVFGIGLILILRSVAESDRMARFKIIGDALILPIRGDEAVHPGLRETHQRREKADKEKELRDWEQLGVEMPEQIRLI